MAVFASQMNCLGLQRRAGDPAPLAHRKGHEFARALVGDEGCRAVRVAGEDAQVGSTGIGLLVFQRSGFGLPGLSLV